MEKVDRHAVASRFPNEFLALSGRVYKLTQTTNALLVSKS